MLRVTESPELKWAMKALMKGEVATFDTKWLRVKGAGEYTEIHTDYFRFEKLASAGRMVVAWIPLCSKLAPEEGGLSLLTKSHVDYDYCHEIDSTELPGDFIRKVKAGGKAQ